MNRPHVLFVCPALEIGGAERQLSLLAPALARRGLDVRIVTIRSRGPLFEELAAAGVDVRFGEVRSRFDLAGVRRVVREVGSWPDLVVSQSVDAQLVGVVLAGRLGIPHLTIHHTQPELTLALHRRLLTRIVARRVDAVVPVTQAQVPVLLGAGFRRELIHPIENGVGDPATRARAEVRAELGIAEDAFVALLVATLRPEKRPDVFVRAVTRAHERDASIRGLVAGGGPGLERVRSAAAGTPVAVLGERSDVEDVIAAADVLCLTSSAEALPMVVLEALALGRPVVSTDVGGVPDAVGDAGMILPVDDGSSLADALVRLAGDPAAVEAMGRAARTRYESRFSAELMAERYYRLMLELLDGART